ncbi:hypothetical protein Syun_020056 [Stephania yunnanensis]|uniref:Uncharacterized protein n=1 Tax=Stephania yunnanensis TaxID=152371 RepID=A0AAP0NXW8_9MAGN
MVLGIANYIGLKNHKPPPLPPPPSSTSSSSSPGDDEVEEESLKRKNMELERELKKSMEREQKMRDELKRTAKRLLLLQEAEEMLCSQMGELEAEALQQVRYYRAKITSLTDQLSHAHNLLHSNNTTTTSITTL